MGQNKNAMTLRQTAKDCMKDGRQTEAFLHLSHALKLDEGNVEILSERSKCCIENLQYHFALEDANKILELSPDSWLGHVRLAEIYLATANYEEALGRSDFTFLKIFLKPNIARLLCCRVPVSGQ